MEIYYKSKKLEKILTDDLLLKRHFKDLFSSIKNRISEFQVATNLLQISHKPPPKRHKLKGDYKGYWAVNISAKDRIIFKAYYEDQTDPLEITAILICQIKDYH